ncbi:hypothetical protein [uncultured Kordia sp.]|uniref:hypothetical protein n=1 Tax=uncultured Kordia sp. TaxID=507699 RepID=UPI002616135E|nr:hypothetical protein [uncultured Kordia sp.]
MKTKKYTIIPILISAFIMLSSCTNKKTDWDLYELKGKVKTYNENHYNPVEKSGEWQKGKPLGYGSSSVSFTKEGDHERIDIFDKNNDLSAHQISKKENGKMVEELKYDAKGNSEGITKYTYLSETELEFVSYDPDGNEVGTGKLFYKDGKIIKRNFKTLYKGRVEFEVEMKFLRDENGMTTAIEKKYPDGGVVTTKFEYVEFDEHDNWTKRFSYTPEDSERPEKIAIRTYEYYK